MTYTIPNLVLSDSSLQRWNSCHRKLELNKLYGHARAEREDSLAADSGTCLHAGWQTYMATNSKRDGAWALMKRYPYHLQSNPMAVRSIESLYATYLEMLAHPLDGRYQLANVNVLGAIRPAVEVPFRITFCDISLFPDRYVPIQYIGFIDAILWDTIELKYVVVDVKTTRKVKSDYSAMFQRDPQCLPYAYILETIQNHPISSLDVIYFVAFIDALEPKVYKYDFIKTADDIQSWGFDIAKTIKDIQLFAQLEYFPKNGKNCDTWGVCQYHQVCDYKDPVAIRQYLDLQYSDVNTVVDDFVPWFEIDLSIAGLSA